MTVNVTFKANGIETAVRTAPAHNLLFFIFQAIVFKFGG